MKKFLAILLSVVLLAAAAIIPATADSLEEQLIADLGTAPEDANFNLVINAPESYEPGSDIEVTVTLENVETKIHSLIFTLKYDSDKLTITNDLDEWDNNALLCVDLPSGWENFSSVANDYEDKAAALDEYLNSDDAEEIVPDELQVKPLNDGVISGKILTTSMTAKDATNSVTFTFTFKVADDATGDLGFVIPHASAEGARNVSSGLNMYTGNGSYAITKGAEVEPEPEIKAEISQWGSGSAIDVLTDGYIGIDEVLKWEGNESKLHGYGNAQVVAGDYSFDVAIGEKTFNGITLYTLDFAGGAVMLPEVVTFVVNGVEYAATITANENNIATISVALEEAVTASTITVKATMGESPYTFGVFNMYTELAVNEVEVVVEPIEITVNATLKEEASKDEDGNIAVFYAGESDRVVTAAEAWLRYQWFFVTNAEGNIVKIGQNLVPNNSAFVGEVTVPAGGALVAFLYNSTSNSNQALMDVYNAILEANGLELFYNNYEEVESNYYLTINDPEVEPEIKAEISQWAGGSAIDVLTDGYIGIDEVLKWEGNESKLHGYGNAQVVAGDYSFDVAIGEKTFNGITLYTLDYAGGCVMLPEAVTFVVNGVEYAATITANENNIATISVALEEAVTASTITVKATMGESPYTFGIFNMYTELAVNEVVVEPDLEDVYELLVSHHNLYNWGTYESMIISGDGKTVVDVIGQKPHWWIMYVVEKVEGRYVATEYYKNCDEINTTVVPEGGFLYYVYSDNSAWTVADEGKLLGYTFVLGDIDLSANMAIDTTKEDAKVMKVYAPGVEIPKETVDVVVDTVIENEKAPDEDGSVSVFPAGDEDRVVTSEEAGLRYKWFIITDADGVVVKIGNNLVANDSAYVGEVTVPAGGELIAFFYNGENTANQELMDIYTAVAEANGLTGDSTIYNNFADVNADYVVNVTPDAPDGDESGDESKDDEDVKDPGDASSMIIFAILALVALAGTAVVIKVRK